MQRTADVYRVSQTSSQDAAILPVLRLRQEAVRDYLEHCPLSQRQDEEAVILDKNACLHVNNLLREEWMREPGTETVRKEVWERAVLLARERRKQGERASTKDIYRRSMKSYWKTTVFHRYGGEIWLFTLIATGRVHTISVEIVNDIIAAHIRGVAKRSPTSDPRRAQSRTKARASSQGKVKGVQHKKILPSRLRDQARWADKRRWRHDERWWKAQRHMSKDEEDWWRRRSASLRQEADDLWATAKEESLKAGHPFQDRDGTTVGPVRLSTFERSLKILKERIKAGKVTWPPAQ